MEKKHKALKVIIISVSVVVLLAGAAAAVYFLAFGTMTLVADDSFMQVVPSGTLSSMRLHLAGKGVRLKVVKLPESSFSSADVFSTALAGLRSDYVVLTPVPAAYAVHNEIDVSTLIPSASVTAIHDQSGSEFFDCILVSDVGTGWERAADAMNLETSSMSQNLALVYGSTETELAQSIVSCFPEGHVTEFVKESASRMFASTTIDQMDKQGIVIAMCPYVSYFSSFFDSGSSVYWITDYRIAQVVPEGYLYGVVSPDFISACSIALTVEKGSHVAETLEYIYEKK